MRPKAVSPKFWRAPGGNWLRRLSLRVAAWGNRETRYVTQSTAPHATQLNTVAIQAGPLAKKTPVVGMIVLAIYIAVIAMLMPTAGYAQDARVAKSMAALIDRTTKLGVPKIVGSDLVGGRDAPALYFGSTLMNNNSSIVDAVAEEGGRGMAATLFVKSGDDYIRVATNVSSRIGSGRGLGTVLTGAPLQSIKSGNAYYGRVSVLGTHYVSGYEPIKDASGAIIGAYFVGYQK
jgi:hypothetical protein